MYIEEIAKLGIAAGEKTEVCRKSPVKYGYAAYRQVCLS